MDKGLELLKIIYDTAQCTAPVTVQIGYTVNNICREGIMLKEAAPRIINVLIEHGYSCDLTPDGLLVYKI